MLERKTSPELVRHKLGKRICLCLETEGNGALEIEGWKKTKQVTVCLWTPGLYIIPLHQFNLIQGTIY